MPLNRQYARALLLTKTKNHSRLRIFVDMTGKFAILIIILFSSILQLTAHPYFVSVTEIHVSPEKKSINISCSMFTEDLESAIKSIYSIKPDLQKQIGAAEVLDYIYQYLQKRLSVKIGGESIKYTLLGCENIEESTWAYLEGAYTSESTMVEIHNSILFDFLEEQTNMVHVYWGEERQSTKLNNPNSSQKFTF